MSPVFRLVGDKPVFHCDLCPTTCGRKTDLRIHVQKLHTAEKPLKCKRCGGSFPDRYSYKVRLLTSSVIQIHRAQWKYFASSYNLASHKDPWRRKMLQVRAVSICIDISPALGVAYARPHRSKTVPMRAVRPGIPTKAIAQAPCESVPRPELRTTNAQRKEPCVPIMRSFVPPQR